MHLWGDQKNRLKIDSWHETRLDVFTMVNGLITTTCPQGENEDHILEDYRETMDTPMISKSVIPLILLVTTGMGAINTGCYDPVDDSLVSSYFPNCNSLSSTASVCSSLDGNQFFDCQCQPDFLNLIYDCGDEFTACADTDQVEQGVDDILTAWSSECGTGFAAAVSTAAPESSKASPVSKTRAPESSSRAAALTTPAPDSSSLFLGDTESICSDVLDACKVEASSIDGCSTSYSDSTDRLSGCICKPDLLTIASVCEYVGNATCLDEPATLTNVDLFQLCPVSLYLPFQPIILES